jgi:hypothetical protein
MSARVIVFIHEKTKASFRLHRSFTSIPMNALTAVPASQSARYRQSSPSKTFQNNGRASRRSMPTGTWQKKGKWQNPEALPMQRLPQPGGPFVRRDYYVFMTAVVDIGWEALRGNRKGQHSIRINDQWRICFAWREGHCFDVEIVDYH